MNLFQLSYPDAQTFTKTIGEFGCEDGGAIEIGTACFEAGQRAPAEGLTSHPHTELSIIIEGSLEVVSGGKTHHLTAGDVVVVPAQEQHCTRAIENTKLIYCFISNKED